MILLDRDREAARRRNADPVRFARVDFVGTLRNGRRLLHVRWFRSTTTTGGFAFFRHAPAPDPLRNPAGQPGARRHSLRHPHTYGFHAGETTTPALRRGLERPRENHENNVTRTATSRAEGGSGSRYHYDFSLCSTTGQWARIDTGQDAPWFGQWANPFERRILCYAEGDLSCTACDTDEESTAELDRIAEFHRNNDAWKGIDPWSTALLERFVAAGAGHLVHAACFRTAERVRTGSGNERLT